MGHDHIQISRKYSGATKMENTAAKNSSIPSGNRPIVLKEIGAKWNKFSDQELSLLRSRDDVVKQVQGKYGLNQEQAQRDVDALLKGRQFS
jgi:hypothetical protein